MSSRPSAIGSRDDSRAPKRVDAGRERNATPGATKGHHFNSAGAALPSIRTVDTVLAHLKSEESMGGYEAATAAKQRVEAVYESAARLVGGHREEIALFDSATTGLRVLVEALRIAPGVRILASRSTYVSHALHLMSVARERDVPLVILPVDEHRRVDLDALETLLSDGTPSIVSVAHIPTSSGVVEPAAEIGALVARYGGTYILDATQSVGHIETNVTELGCHMLVTTGRKFLRAPRGTGFAHVSADLIAQLPPTAPDVRGATWHSALDWDVDPSARRYESWEASIAGRLGLGCAIDEALERGVTATQDWLVARGGQLRAELEEIPGVTVTDPGAPPSALVTFVVDGVAPADTVATLAQRSVRVVSVPQSHGQWDLGDRGIPSVVRASPHVYNSDDDLAALLEAVRDSASSARAGAVG